MREPGQNARRALRRVNFQWNYTSVLEARLAQAREHYGDGHLRPAQLGAELTHARLCVGAALYKAWEGANKQTDKEVEKGKFEFGHKMDTDEFVTWVTPYTEMSEDEVRLHLNLWSSK